MFFDPMWFVFGLPGLLLALYAQWKVKSTYNKYAQVASRRGAPGADVARALLDSSGLYNVRVERIPGELSDHYDPSQKVLRLSDSNYASYSVAAMGVTAHEVGHAMQDATGYAPMRWRHGLVPLVNIGSTLGYLLFMLGFFMMYATGAAGGFGYQIAWLGVILFASVAVFAAVTLPVEFNASSRALVLLERNGFVTSGEQEHAKHVLDAAALTYVAGLAQALGQLLYFVFILTGMRGRED